MRTAFFLSVLYSSCPAQEPALLRSPSTLVYPDFWHTPLGIHRATPLLLKFFLGERTTFDDPQDLACTRLKEHGDETPKLTAFGLNSGKSQIIYNPNLSSLEIFGSPGSAEGQFNHPQAIACLPDGRLAVADTGNHRIALLRYRGGKLWWDKSFTGEGSPEGPLRSPSGVALDSQGRIYVSDTGNHRIRIFDPQGGSLLSFGDNPELPNHLVEPQALAVVDPLEPFAHKPSGAIFVVDQYHGRVQKFDLSGNFLSQADARDLERHLVYFSGLALDYYNNLWVVDRGNHMIHKFDQYLQWVDSWGNRGQGDYRLHSPRGIAIYRPYGQVLISEKESVQYLWIGADVKDIKVYSARDKDGRPAMRLDYKLTERGKLECWVEAAVEKGARPRLATLIPRQRQAQGLHTLLWDGVTSAGARIQPGVYWVVFQAEALYSSATYFKKEALKKFWVR